jgi:drug/metabolite transporter (DMT)-like permease
MFTSGNLHREGEEGIRPRWHNLLYWSLQLVMIAAIVALQMIPRIHREESLIYPAFALYALIAGVISYWTYFYVRSRMPAFKELLQQFKTQATQEKSP